MNIELDNLIFKTNVAISQSSSEYLKTNLKPALLEWKEYQASIFKEHTELYNYIINAPFVIKMNKIITVLTLENKMLQEKITVLEREQNNSRISNNSNIILEITERPDNKVKLVDVSNADIFGIYQNDVITDLQNDTDNEDNVDENEYEQDNIWGENGEDYHHDDDDSGSDDDSDDDSDSDHDDDSDDDSGSDDNDSGSDDDDSGSDDNDSGSDDNVVVNFKSINRNTYGDDISLEVHETTISDTLFTDSNYYVTNEIDGDIYIIDNTGNVGSKIGKYINKNPTLI